MTLDLQAHLDDDRCAELVLGLLAEPVRDAAIAHAERCEACARMLHAHVSAQARAHADRPGARVQRIPRLPRIAYWLPAAAALIVVSVLLVRNVVTRSPGTEAHWLPALGEPQLLRGESPPDAHLAAGMQAYAARDLERATRELALARATGPAEQARCLYLAHAWLELGEPERALPLLRDIDHSELPLDLAREAARMLVRTLRATGRASEADSLEAMLRRTPEWVPVRP